MPLHGWEILIVLIVILIIFGPGKLPQVFGALGKGIREFRKSKDAEIDSDSTSKQIKQTDEDEGENKD